MVSKNLHLVSARSYVTLFHETSLKLILYIFIFVVPKFVHGNKLDMLVYVEI